MGDFNFKDWIVGGLKSFNPIGAIFDTVNTVGSIISNKNANDTNAEINEKNLQFQREQFNYQKYLNNNQTQIQAADALKAGINPLAMSGGSLSGGSYSNASNPMQSVFNGGLGSLYTELAKIENQKSISDDRNKTDEYIAELNSETSRNNTILKILSDERIANNLNENQKELLIRRLASEEKIASGNLSETTRHNMAMENIQDSIAKTQKILNDATVNHYEKMDRIKALDSQMDRVIKNNQDRRLDEELKIKQGYLRQAIKENNIKLAKVIIDGINDLLRTSVNVVDILPDAIKVLNK